MITLYPRKITVTGLRDREEAARVLNEVKELINQTYANRQNITPSYKKGGEVKPLQVYNLLPRTNCKKCGEPSCFAFAARLVKQEVEPAACAPLAETGLAGKQTKAGRAPHAHLKLRKTASG